MISGFCTPALDFIKNMAENEQGTAPHVYGVVINHIVVEGDGNNVWKLVKVGQTADTNPGNNTMETVKRQAQHWCQNHGFQEPEVKTLFVLRISDDDDEQKVRMAFGVQVTGALATQLQLPFDTEWVLTSQMYIDRIKKSIKDESTSKLITENPFSYELMQNNPNAVTVGSLNLLGTQIPVHASQTYLSGIHEYTVYELSQWIFSQLWLMNALQPTPTEDQEPPTEAVYSSSTNDQESQSKEMEAAVSSPASTTESEGSHGATVPAR